MSKMSDRTMLVVLRCLTWAARANDTGARDEITTRRKATKRAVRVAKYLMPKPAPAYDALMAAFGDLRVYHYEQTLPWLQNGSRILAAKNFMDYSTGIRHRRDRIENVLLPAFLKAYPDYQQQASKQITALGLLYNREDYPSVRDLRDRFSVKVTVLPLPDVDDFRCAYADVDIEAIKRETQADIQEAFGKATLEIWERLQAVVGALREKLAEKNPRFHDTLVENVRDMVTLLPKLNFTNDPKLEAMRKTVEKLLLKHQPDSLRADGKLRRQVAQEAKQIEEKMKAYMGGLGKAA